MYAGNHSPCNPLDTLRAAARRLATDTGIVFCFVGGGSHFRAIEHERANDGGTPNISCVPYQPRERVSAVLSAGDLHVVTLGDEFRGLIHPCKIYNILNVGAPVLYIGPQESHVTDLIRSGGTLCWHVAHGGTDAAIAAVEDARKIRGEAWRAVSPASSVSFSQAELLPQLIAIITSERLVPMLGTDPLPAPHDRTALPVPRQ